MRVPRPARVAAIAWRDLFQELKGRRGALFGAVTGLLLLPVATVRVDLPPPGEVAWPFTANGDVPPAVAALPSARVLDRPAGLSFTRRDDGTLVVRTQYVPKQVREVLDGPTPEVVVRDAPLPTRLPGRTVLFAMISASVLTGAVSESIGGERSRRTLQALLSAAVTRTEIVTGKWLAWTLYGAGTGLLAALAAVALGRVSGGWWLLPQPLVAAGMVALALYLSRHATDVVGGATVSLRYLPAVLAGSGLLAWYLGDTQPLVGAAVPIGGALLAAGDAWEGPVPALVAVGSTGLFTAATLVLTARDLDQPPEPPTSLWRRTREALIVAGIASLAWWAPLAGPVLWGLAGNPLLTEGLPRAPGVWAGSLALLLLSLVRGARVLDPSEELGLVGARPLAWAVALGAGVALATSPGLSALVPQPEAALFAGARPRIEDALQPVWVGPAGLLLAIAAQEMLFRGWLQRLVGPVLATLAFALVTGPLAPGQALVVGATLAGVTHLAGGSILPAIAARLVWAVVAAPFAGASPAVSLVVGVGVAAAIYAATRYAAGRPWRST